MQQFDFRSPKAFFERYLVDFQKIGLDWSEKDADWTHKNLEYFDKLGKSQGYKVWWQYGGGEYLVDLCWLVSGEQHYWMELALEQEWKGSFKDIKEDFFKLMDVKACLKVFVCFPYKHVIPDLPSRLAREISRHKIKISDEAYLLIILSRDASCRQAERLKVEGFGIDYRGSITPLGEKYFPDRVEVV